MAQRRRTRPVRQTRFGINELRRMLLRRPERDNGHPRRHLVVDEVGYFLVRGTLLQRRRARRLLVAVLTNGWRKEGDKERYAAFCFLTRHMRNGGRRERDSIKVQKALLIFRTNPENEALVRVADEVLAQH